MEMKIEIFDQKNIKFFSTDNFVQFLVIKTLDPDWIRIRSGIQPKVLDPDPDSRIRIRNTVHNNRKQNI
jgi:hypothetical protein